MKPQISKKLSKRKPSKLWLRNKKKADKLHKALLMPKNSYHLVSDKVVQIEKQQHDEVVEKPQTSENVQNKDSCNGTNACKKCLSCKRRQKNNSKMVFHKLGQPTVRLETFSRR